jgi:hypothetical protein
MEVALS